MEDLDQEKGTLDYMWELLAMPLEGMHDLVGKAWAIFYLMVAFVLIGGLVNKIPSVEISRVINFVALVVLVGCLGVAIKTSPNLSKWWTFPGRAELLGIMSGIGLSGFLLTTI